MARNRLDPTRHDLEKDEDQRLAAVAMRSARAQRCMPRDPEGRAFDYRTEFQRDRDRILHSRAFSRLRLKSHGGATPPAEPCRDRMTHTLEVSQLARTVGRSLSLNEDLVEAIALGHELGTPPFGRAGETALAAALGAKAGGFLGGAQSLRVVDRIEKWYRHPGLNLTDAVREGILKTIGAESMAAAMKQIDAEGEALAQLRAGWPPFFEAQVVTAVDEVAGVVQDLDDGLRAGALDYDEVTRLPIVAELNRKVPGTRGGRGGLHMKTGTLYRGLTHMLVAGLIQSSRRAIDAWAGANGVKAHEDFWKARPRMTPAVALPVRTARMFHGLREFIERRLHQGALLRGVAARARHIISGLFETLTADPRLAPDYLLLRFREENGGPWLRDLTGRDADREIRQRYLGSVRFARLVADHISGMTDPFAAAEYERLLGPFAAAATGGPAR